ncbi:YciI family protein [Ensifer sp. 4252]|uniref:YciI family protein n=1 Tax=Ensifer sp. 4252 TaxID=3373915 RepID=UPI003D1D02E4
MYYAILAYHEEGVVESWTEQEDAALMTELLQVNDRLVREKSLGPAARLGPTQRAVTLRGKGEGTVIDGPFAETKEQLLGFYVVDFPTLEAAVTAARELRRANPTATYEIRPISLYLPGTSLDFKQDYL